VHDQARVDGDVGEGTGADRLLLPERRHLVARDVEVGQAGVAAVDDLLGAVLLGGETDRRRLDAEREVLRDDRDREAVVRQVRGDREDARVVVAELQPGRQHRHVRVVQLDPERAARPDLHREVEAVVRHAEAVEEAQRLSREVAQLRIVALALELADDDDGQHHVVLGEPEDRLRVAEQDGRVEHVGALVDGGGPIGRSVTGGGALLLGPGVDGHDDSISERRCARYLRQDGRGAVARRTFVAVSTGTSAR
jgi:hypothetical protein